MLLLLHHDSTTQFALVTLGDSTPIGLLLFVSYHPRWPDKVGVPELWYRIPDYWTKNFVKSFYQLATRRPYSPIIGQVFGKTIANSAPQFCHSICLGHLGRLSTNRIASICVISSKVTRGSKDSRIMKQSFRLFAKNFAKSFYQLTRRRHYSPIKQYLHWPSFLEKPLPILNHNSVILFALVTLGV